jgi:bifunctional non-homologous end joining protein LigD
MPDTEYRPQLATLGSEPPSGDRWLHEIKYDGYRIGCVIDKKGARLISRNGKDWTHVFPSIAEAAQTLKTRDAIIDGEVAMVMPDGRTSFAALQQAAAGTASHTPLVYFVFDLLRLDGERLDRLPLEERKARLRALVEPAPPKPKAKAGLASPKPKAKAGRIRYAEHIVGGGEKLFEHATSIGLEGIISKRRDLPYEPGRSDSWRKSKVIQRGVFVIGGMTDPEGTRVGIGALLVGYYAPRQGSGHPERESKGDGPRLVFAGRVGTGFSHAFAIELRERLDALAQKPCPFDPPIVKGPERLAHWVKPVLVCEATYTEWTNDKRLRHPVFVKIRRDVKPKDITPPLTSSLSPRQGRVRAADQSAGSLRR